MSYQQTAQALEAITDEGLFELLASAVLREACELCPGLSHPGINSKGKTIKSVLDGINWVPDANPPHIIAVHHTTMASKGLRAKWLCNPTTVKARNGKKPTALEGDLIKTAKFIAKEREGTPDLQATLILTTNQEPDEKLYSDVHAEGHKHGMTIDIWPRSRLCHILVHPRGQWLRAYYLGIEQELLSPELLHELSLQSLSSNQIFESADAWVDRSLDDTLKNALHRDVTFLVAESGLGKSIACHRLLAAHIENGGFGLILSHGTLASVHSLEQTVTEELRRLHPRLSQHGPSALEFCSPDNPLLLIVEDINQSGQDASRLAEKIASWSHISSNQDERISPSSPWRLICPVWPQSLNGVREQARKHIDQLCLMAKAFSEEEGTNAVLARGRLAGHQLSRLDAQEIASAFGYDPLLIGLHDPSKKPDSNSVIADYIESSLGNAANDGHDHACADYRVALQALAAEMLQRRHIVLAWLEVKRWFSAQSELSSLLARIAHKGKLLHFEGLSDQQQLIFRHDRVRDWLLADGVINLHRTGSLSDDLIAEPYFAEVLGAALARSDAWKDMLERVAPVNPLALFHAFRLTCQVMDERQQAILHRITEWLKSPDMPKRTNAHLRWEALATLARTDSANVPTLVRMFPDRTHNSLLARFRNDDFEGGIELCQNLDPGENAPWRDVQIEHANLHCGEKLTKYVAMVLRQTDLENPTRIGALRLAGHLANHALAEVIEICWRNDQARIKNLAEYLWAFAECCGDDPARYLGPVCDSWAALPDKAEQNGHASPRDELVAHNLRWAFRKCPPVSAIDYFISRAKNDDLRWPITYMLHEVDHPATVLFVAQEFAEIQLSGGIASLSDHWRRAQEDGHPMSKTSRDVLFALWQNSGTDKHLRTTSFSLWAETTCSEDLTFLQAVTPPDDLFEHALAQRLKRGDQSAIPEMIKKLDGESADHWWFYGRHVWSAELTSALDVHLTRRGKKPEPCWGDACNADYFMSELIIRLPTDEAESLLLKHWSHLCFSPPFVQAALYTATPRLQKIVAIAVNEAPDQAQMFELLTMRWGCNKMGHPGVTKQEQLLALTPYFSLLSRMEIEKLWYFCNRNGWFDLRRKIIDEHLPKTKVSGWWDSDHVQAVFDDMLKEKHAFNIVYSIRAFLKAGVNWNDILTTMGAWLKQRHSLDALNVVASALAYEGTRNDLMVLKNYEDMGDAAVEIIKDTTFAVYRRTIH